MQLILVRHAIALDREAFLNKTGLDDSLRPLSVKGRKKMQKIALELQSWIKSVDLIVTSPYLRARQTAELLSEIFINTKLIESAELVPHGHPDLFVKWLRSHGKNHKKIMMVGHEPQLSSFASYLMAGKSASTLVLKKSGVACLHVPDWDELDMCTAQLLWLVQPRQIVD